MLLTRGNDAKTRFYTRLPIATFAVFIALFKFMEAYIAVACQCASDLDNSLKCRKKCLSPGEELFAVLMRMQLGLWGGRCSRSLLCFNFTVFTYFQDLEEVFPWPSRDSVMARTPVQLRKYPADTFPNKFCKYPADMHLP